MELACGEFHGGRGIVLGHAGGVCAKASSRRQYVEENEARFGFDGLPDGNGHEPVEIKQIGGDEDDLGMRPSFLAGRCHGRILVSLRERWHEASLDTVVCRTARCDLDHGNGGGGRCCEGLASWLVGLRRQDLYSLSMKTQHMLTTAKALGMAVFFAAALGWSQSSNSSQNEGVKHDMKAAGHDVKKDTVMATHATERDTKKAAHATAKDTKKVAHATAMDTKKAAHATAKDTRKAWDKTKDTTAGAFHGAKKGAEQKTN